MASGLIKKLGLKRDILFYVCKYHILPTRAPRNFAFLPASFVLQYPQVTKLPKYNSKEERFLKQNTTMDLVANREVCDR